MSIQTMKEAKRAAEETEQGVSALNAYLDGVAALIDAATDVAAVAEEFEHEEYGKGFFVPAHEFEILRRNTVSVE